MLHVQKLACILFSVRAAAKIGNTVEFGRSRCWIRGPNGSLDVNGISSYTIWSVRSYLQGKASVMSDLWHQCLGHLNGQQLNTIVEKELASERLNCTLMESARAMLSHAKLPSKFLAKAVATAAYLRNRAITSASEELLTPFDKWYGRKPDISHLKVFGCAAYSHVPATE